MLVKKWDIIICLVLSAVLGIFAFELRDITPIARIYPLCVIIGSYIMIAIIFWQSIRGAKKSAAQAAKQVAEAPMGKKAVARIVIYCAAILVYILMIEVVGYIVSTIAFALFSLLFQQNRNKIVIIVLPFVLALVMYYIFSQFLYVTLPLGSLIESLL